MRMPDGTQGSVVRDGSSSQRGHCRGSDEEQTALNTCNRWVDAHNVRVSRRMTDGRGWTRRDELKVGCGRAHTRAEGFRTLDPQKDSKEQRSAIRGCWKARKEQKRGGLRQKDASAERAGRCKSARLSSSSVVRKEIKTKSTRTWLGFARCSGTCLAGLRPLIGQSTGQDRPLLRAGGFSVLGERGAKGRARVQQGEAQQGCMPLCWPMAGLQHTRLREWAAGASITSAIAPTTRRLIKHRERQERCCPVRTDTAATWRQTGRVRYSLKRSSEMAIGRCLEG